MQEDSTRNDDRAQQSDEASERESADSGKGLGLRQILGSVFAAGLGVQSSRNRERDFKEGSAGTFILAGAIFTALFIGGIYLIVQLVLSSSA